MVAKITIPHSILRALNYNELKVQKGVAECLHAENFLKEAPQMNFQEKLHRFENLIALNKRATTNTVHLSLNFDVSEKLERKKLVEIAKVFMQKIGFGAQPYLIYEHRDSGHPHLHIVSTNIQANGKRISLHNIGRNEVNRARKEIEIIYGLIKAEEKKPRITEQIKPPAVQKAVYGKGETKRSITGVVEHVIHQYHYTSLSELNAVLRLYNVYADRGSKGGRINQNKGLTYRILDERGNKIGVPIKASSIKGKPTLALLEKKFEENETLRAEHKKGLKTLVDWALLKPGQSLAQVIHSLEKEKITVMVHRNKDEMLHGLTYIDHNTRSVFKSSDLGNDYCAQKILERLGLQQTSEPKLNPSFYFSNPYPSSPADLKKEIGNRDDHHYVELKSGIEKVIELLIKSDQQEDHLPYELKKERKKKKQFPGYYKNNYHPKNIDHVQWRK